MPLSPGSRVVFYCRYSKGDEAEKELSIDAQVAELTKYAQKNGLTHVATYVDRDISGRTEEREQFQEMIAKAKETPKPFDGILVWKFNRFSRNVEHRLVYRSLLRRRNIEVESLNEPAVEGAMGALIEVILAAIYEFMAMQVSEDTLRGLKQLARSGYFTGGVPPKGLKAVRTQVGTKGNGEPVFRTKLELDEVWAPRVVKAFEMVTEGATAEEIMNVTGVVSNKSSMATFLRNRRLIGEETYNKQRHVEKKSIRKTNDEEEWIVVPDNHPAVVTRDLFDRVGAILDARRPTRSTPRQRNSIFLFTDVLRCRIHDAPYVGTSNGHHEYYICSQRNKHGKSGCRMIYREPFERMIIDQLQDHIFSPAVLRATLEDINQNIGKAEASYDEDLASVTSDLTKARKELRRLQNAVIKGIDPAQLKEPLETTSARLAALEEEKARLEGAKFEPLAINDELIADITAIALQHLTEGDPEQAKNFLRDYVRKIEIDGDRATVYYTKDAISALATADSVVTLWLPEPGATLSLQLALGRALVPSRHASVRHSADELALSPV